MATKAVTTGLERLLEPFSANEINKLPKPTQAGATKGKCNECGGWHGLPAVHLDYVGHAALTKRLLEADPNWFWEPVAFDDNGLPQFDGHGGLWIRLTVCGISRLGYGDSQGKTGPNAVKEAIGDALRNAGMRFGAALDLWHKGDLHDASEERGGTAPKIAPVVAIEPVKPVEGKVTPTDAPKAPEGLLLATVQAINEATDLDPLRAIWVRNANYLDESFHKDGENYTLRHLIEARKAELKGKK